MNRAKRILSRAALLGAAGAMILILAGCGGGGAPDDHFYRLSPPPPDGAYQPAPISGALLVERFRADGVLSQRPILFLERDKPVEVKQYNYHYWVESPPNLIQLQLIDFLRQVNIAGRVVERSGRVFRGCVLSGTLRKFERVLADGTSVAHVAADYWLSRSENDAQFFFQSREARAEAGGPSMPATIRAFNQAAGRLFDDIATDIAGVGHLCPKE